MAHDFDEELRKATWDAITETGLHQEVADEIARVRPKWRKMSPRRRGARLSQMLSCKDPHGLLMVVGVAVIRVTGRDPYTPIFLREGMRNRRMLRVRRDRKRRAG